MICNQINCQVLPKHKPISSSYACLEPQQHEIILYKQPTCQNHSNKQVFTSYLPYVYFFRLIHEKVQQSLLTDDLRFGFSIEKLKNILCDCIIISADCLAKLGNIHKATQVRVFVIFSSFSFYASSILLGV